MKDNSKRWLLKSTDHSSSEVVQPSRLTAIGARSTANPSSTLSKHQPLSNQQFTPALEVVQPSRLTAIGARSSLTRHTGDPDVIGWSALETTLAGPFLPLLSERGKCVAVPASSSSDVEN